MTFNLRLRDETDYKIKIIAKTENRSKNKQIEYILNQFIEKYEQANGIIEFDEEINANEWN